MTTINILQTPARFYPAIGGVEQYTLDLSKELVKRGHQVKIICANEPKSNINKVEGISVKRLSYLFKLTNTNITLGLFSTLLKEDFDIVHTHFPTPWSSDISMIISYLKRKPLVLTYHNDVVKEGIQGVLAELYNHVFLKLLLKRSARILITQPEYINISRYLYRYKHKIEVIPNGIDTQIYCRQQTRRIPHQILFVSVLDKFHEYKGLDYLIKAIRLVQTEIPDIRLIVGGGGELVKDYKVLAKELDLEEHIEFRGFIESRQLVDLYSQSELCVLPSIGIQEGFGIVLLEALACGTPVVATSLVGIAKDVIDYACGLIVETQNSNELAQAIIALLSNPATMKTMGNNGSKLVEDKYSWSNIAEKVTGIYEELHTCK